MASAGGGEGTRVVFVSVRGRDAALPRTRRKRALGVSDDTTWEAFCALVCARLSLRGVKAIYHASTGAPMRSMEELQDIEDLDVEELEEQAPPANGRPSPGAPGGYASPPAARKASGSAAWVPESIAVAVGTPGGDAEEGDKYARRVPLHTRSLQQLQQLLPSWAGGGAPQASAARSAAPATPGRRACAADGDSLGEPSTTRRRKPQRRASLRQLKDPRTMLVLIALFSCAGTLMLLHSRLSPLERH